MLQWYEQSREKRLAQFVPILNSKRFCMSIYNYLTELQTEALQTGNTEIYDRVTSILDILTIEIAELS